MNEMSQPPAPPKSKLRDRVRQAIQLGVALARIPLAAPAYGPPLLLSPGLDSMARATTALLPIRPEQWGDRRPGEIEPRPD